MTTDLAAEAGEAPAIQQASLAARIVMVASSIPAALSLSSLAPILPKMDAALAHTPNDRLLVKMVIGIIGVAMALGAPLGGYLGDRMNRAAVITWATVIAITLGTAEYFIDDLRLMVLTRLAMGIAAASAMTIGFAMVSDIADQAMRHKYMGITISVATFSSALALPLAGVLGDIYWRLAFLLLLIPLPLAILAYAEIGKAWTEPRPADKPADIATHQFRFPIRLMALGLYEGILQYVPLTYMAFQFRSIGVTSSAKVGVALTTETIIVVVASAFYGSARAYVSSRTTFGLGFSLIALGGAVVALAHVFVPDIVGLSLIGIGIGLFQPNLITLAGETAAPETRARSVGLVKGTGMSGSFIGVLIIEPIVRAFGVEGVFIAMTVAACAGALYFMSLARGSATSPALAGNPRVSLR